MSIIETRPFPLLQDEGLSYAKNNRIAPLLQPDVDYPCADDLWPCTMYHPMPLVCIPEPQALEKMCALYVAAVVRLFQAKANNEQTRPIVLNEWSLEDDRKHGMLLVKLKGPARPSLGILQARPAEEEQPPQPEFTWSKTLYKARKAAQEYSQETHADY